MISQELQVPLCLALNALSSIGIIYVNKRIFKDMGFPYGTTLTFLHCVTTSIGALICLALGMFSFKKLNIMKVVPLSACFCGFVALTNISLVYNSVGFYQLVKVLTTPMLVVLQTVFYKQRFSTKVKLSLVVTCVGVALATVSDPKANMFGTIVAFSALLVTCMYQIFVGTVQKELECNSLQLLIYQSPVSSVFLFFLALSVDSVASESFVWPNRQATVYIAISCLFAFFVNLSTFLVIGKTSPVTYNVLGHFKLCVILSLGFVFFGDALSTRTVAGILLTLVGVFSYTHIKSEESAAAQRKADEGKEHESATVVAVTTEDVQVKHRGDGATTVKDVHK